MVATHGGVLSGFSMLCHWHQLGGYGVAAQGGAPFAECRKQRAPCGSICMITGFENTMLLSRKSDMFFFQCYNQGFMQRHHSKLFCPLNHRHKLTVTNYLDHECYVALIL